MPFKKFEDLFVDELKDVYDAERRITKALPKLIKAASSDELRSALEEHLAVTEEHVTRLERVFEMLGKTATRKTCDAMVGLLEEGSNLIEEEAPETIMDAAIIAAAQKVEHYEIATYGTMRDWAKLLGHNDAARLFQQTLDEEGQADKALTKLSQALNVEASEEDEDEEAMVPVRRTNGGNHRAKGARPRSR